MLKASPATSFSFPGRCHLKSHLVVRATGYENAGNRTSEGDIFALLQTILEEQLAAKSRQDEFIAEQKAVNVQTKTLLRQINERVLVF